MRNAIFAKFSEIFIQAINQSLDERRDMMLFEEDSHYWKILEKLAG
ncbi:MAG: hypothetical protein F6J86_27355 [Symploca sp. SIO1B1]|nr:hypothetical protein [Symploca sp. SIO1B1]